MKMKKRIVVLLMALVLAVGLIGCKDTLKSIVHKATWLDVPFRYAPYASWKHKFVRMFVH